MKSMGLTSINRLVEIYNKVWQLEVVPSKWRKGAIVKIPKKGDLSDCSNRRGITLLSVPCKVLSNLIYHRIVESVHDKLWEEQTGFRKGSLRRTPPPYEPVCV